MPGSARSILAIDASPFGHSVSLLPAMRALRRSFPDTFVAAASTTGTCELLAASGLTDETIELGVIRFPDGGAGGALKRGLNLLRHLRRSDIDLVLDFSPRLETQFISRLLVRARNVTPTMFPKTIGLLLDAGRSRQYSNSSGSNYASVLRQIGAEYDDTRLGVSVPAEEDARFERRLSTSGSRGGELLALLYSSNPLAAGGWPVAAFGEIGMRLANNLNARIIAADEPSDNTFTEMIGSLLPANGIKLTEPRALELIAAIARASIVITDERAIARIATELNTPVIEIADSTVAGPSSSAHRVQSAASRRRVSTDQVFDLSCEMIQESRSSSLFNRP